MGIMENEELTADQFDVMMKQWQKEAAANGMGDMMEEWGKLWDESAYQGMG